MTAHHRYHNYSGPRSLLSAQINPYILEYSWEKVAIRENIGGALVVCYHVHHHEIPDVNLSPRHNRINEECLKIGDLISVAASWQEDVQDHVVKYSTSHYQAMYKWFTYSLGICKAAHPLNNLCRLETRQGGPSLGFINPKSNWSDV